MQKAAAKVVGGSEVCATELQVTRAALIRYRSAMAGVVRSIGVSGPTVEDVVHDAFEMACRKPELERPDPRDEGGFQAWLCTLARYAALTARNDNARSREVSSPAEDLENVPEPHRANVGRYDDKVDAAVVLANLDADDRSLLHQHFYEDKTVQELAVERGVPWTTMRSRLDGVIHRARTLVDDRSRRRPVFVPLLLAIWASFVEFASRFTASWSKKQRVVAAGAAGFALGGFMLGATIDTNGANDRFQQLAISDLALRSNAANVMMPAHPVNVAPESSSVVARAALIQPAAKVSDISLVPSPASKTKTAAKANSRKAPAVEDEERDRSILPWAVAAAIRDQEQKGK